MTRRSTLFLFIFFWVGLSIPAKAEVTSSSDNVTLKGRVIVLDAGHGVVNFTGRVINPGRDSTQGYREYKIALQIAGRLGTLLHKEGATVYYTRTWKDFWRQADSTVQDNKCRILFANEIRADAFISIHCDWQPSRRARGISTYYEKDNSKKLGQYLHSHMIRSMKANDRTLIKDNYTVLDLAEVPAVLIEVGFLSNRTESKKLISASYQTNLAKALTDGLISYFLN